MNYFNKYLALLLFAMAVIASIALCYYMSFEYNKKFVKAIILLMTLPVFFMLALIVENRKLLYSIVFLSFFNISIVTYYVNSTTLIVVLSLCALFMKAVLRANDTMLLNLIRRNPVTPYLIFLIFVYTISLSFVKFGIGYHLMFYHGLLSAVALAFMIIGILTTDEQIERINKIFFFILSINIAYSAFYMFFPKIDYYISNFLSLPEEVTSLDQSRLQGLTFRGEAYGEFLLVCSIYMIYRIISNKTTPSFSLIIVSILTIFTLIGTQLRGANLAFCLTFIVMLFTSRYITKLKKVVIFFLLFLAYAIITFSFNIFLPQNSLISRTKLLLDNSVYSDGIPESRYYAWLPAIRFAKMHNFLGTGPSLKPYTEDVSIKDVKIEGGSGNIIVWPHNVVILILCTTGFYGLLAYALLCFRIISYKKHIAAMAPDHNVLFGGYFYALFALFIEYQKYDGILRHPNASLYIIFIIVGLIFSSNNISPATLSHNRPLEP